jgi:hypothetical protein
MDFLPEEIFFLVVRKCKIRDIINITRICKRYLSIVDIDNEVLKGARESCNNDLIHEALYYNYTYGKSFEKKSELTDDVLFKIHDHVIFIDRLKLWDSSRFITIVIITNDKKYLKYEFMEVLSLNALNPIIPGFDPIDHNKYVIFKCYNYNSLKTLFLSNCLLFLPILNI